MPSSNYRLFEQAMRSRKPVFCMYGGYPRELCPVVLGHSQRTRKYSPSSMAAKASRAFRARANGAVFGSQKSVRLNSAMGPGERDPAISSHKAVSRPSNST